MFTSLCWCVDIGFGWGPKLMVVVFARRCSVGRVGFGWGPEIVFTILVLGYLPSVVVDVVVT